MSPIESVSPAFFTSSPSSRSTPASSCPLMLLTTSFTGALFSMISTTLPITLSSPALILRSSRITDTR